MWSVVRNLLEFVTGIVGLVNAFAGIDNFSGGFARVRDFDDAQRIGVVLFGLLIANSTYRIGMQLYEHAGLQRRSSGPSNRKSTRIEKLAWLDANRVRLRGGSIDAQAILRQMRDED
jgi:hypothetical protein